MTLKDQLREAWAGAAPPPEALARLRARLEGADARSRRPSRRRQRLVTTLAAAAVAGWGLLALTWSAARRESGAAGAPLRVVASRTGAIDGRPATFLVLEDAAGTRSRLVQVAIGDGPSPASVEVALQGATLRTWSEGGVLFGLAVPHDASSSPAVSRPVAQVREDGRDPHDSGDDDPMNVTQIRDASSRLTQAALLALAVGSLPAAPATASAAPAVARSSSATPGSETARALASDEPELLVVKVHADWCTACRKVGAVFDDLAKRLEDEPVLFVELDITNEATLRQSEYLAAALRLGEAWGEHRGAGFILLVDGPTRRVVGRMNLDLGLDELQRRTRQALSAS